MMSNLVERYKEEIEMINCLSKNRGVRLSSGEKGRIKWLESEIKRLKTPLGCGETWRSESEIGSRLRKTL